MVAIEKDNGNFVFEIKGLHKLWAFKSQLTIPAEHIIKAVLYDKELHSFFGLRMPGTNLPGLITAGTYMVDDGTIFCDIVHHSKTIVVELKDEQYKRLVIEVEEPLAAIKLLQDAYDKVTL